MAGTDRLTSLKFQVSLSILKSKLMIYENFEKNIKFHCCYKKIGTVVDFSNFKQIFLRFLFLFSYKKSYCLHLQELFLSARGLC
jgi:hypothetical protein